MKISQAESLIKDLMNQYVPDWEFRWDKATRRFGCCHQNLKRITLSNTLTELNDWDDVKEICKHHDESMRLGGKKVCEKHFSNLSFSQLRSTLCPTGNDKDDEFLEIYSKIQQKVD